MTNPSHEAAAQFLFAARNRGAPGARIPVEHRPANVDDALAIQARVTKLVGRPIGGYKCSVPSDARPVAMAPIFAPAIASQSPYRMAHATSTARIEPEIAFVIARDLPARAAPYSDDEVRDAVKEARFVLEILHSRYAEPGAVTFPELLADSIANQGLFVGPVVDDPWRRKLDAFPVTIGTMSGAGPSQAANSAPSGGSEVASATSVGAHTTRDGKHPDGHPLRPLYWLANYLAKRGDPLRAGMIVTTGSYCGAIDVPLDTPLTIVYGDLGSLAATFSRA
jgi:2-keto-4-pentenoate hydratase